MKNKYHLYILKCSNNSLYTGITTNLEKRMKDHEEGKGSKYVRANLPFKIVYTEIHPDRSTASKRESEIKALSRRDKEKLISEKTKP